MALPDPNLPVLGGSTIPPLPTGAETKDSSTIPPLPTETRTEASTILPLPTETKTKDSTIPPLPIETKTQASAIPPLATDSESDTAPDVIPGNRPTTVTVVKRSKPRARKQSEVTSQQDENQDAIALSEEGPRKKTKKDSTDTHYFGPIPGVEVGQTYAKRKFCSEAGVHRPVMAGISGTANLGSQSIVLSGGYKEDIDEGESFIYTGSGKRSLTDKNQIADQELTKSNAALAVTLFPLDFDPDELDPDGAIAEEWKDSRPIRVVRSSNQKTSSYAPTEGYRYDGIYKLYQYWPEVGLDGFIIYRFEFRRDDPVPPPWTQEGKERIAKLGLVMIGEKADADPGKSKPKRKRVRVTYSPRKKLRELINLDTRNTTMWCNILESSADVNEFVANFSSVLRCPVCEDFVNNPVTLPCGDWVCLECLEGSVKKNGVKCPCCWEFLVEGELDGTEREKIWRESGVGRNEQMVSVLRYFNSAYSGA